MSSLERRTHRTPGCAPLKRRRHSPARSTCADAPSLRSSPLGADMVGKSRNMSADMLFTPGLLALMPPTICCLRSQYVRDFVTEISGGATEHRCSVLSLPPRTLAVGNTPTPSRKTRISGSWHLLRSLLAPFWTSRHPASALPWIGLGPDVHVRETPPFVSTLAQRGAFIITGRVRVRVVLEATHGVGRRVMPIVLRTTPSLYTTRLVAKRLVRM